MKQILLAILFLSSLAALADYQNSNTELIDTIEYTMSIDQYSYTNQDTVFMELKVKNTGINLECIEFPMAEIYDFEIRKDDDFIWRWSTLMVFAQVISYLYIEPGDSLEFFEEYDFSSHWSELIEGNYTITGYLTCYDEVSLSVYFDLEIISSLDPVLSEKSVKMDNYPNPFNPETTIRFTLANQSDNNEISIYNLKGQRVYSKDLSSYPAGENQVTWKGITNNGSPVASGIYFYQLKANGNICDTRRMLLLK